jgi:hypothetical protein
MINVGTIRPGSTIYIPFETFAGSTGAPVTMTGLAASVTNVKVYKDGSTTEQASAASFTLLDTDGIDFDGLTGIHGFSINLADNTTAGFYTAGGRYFVVVTGLTVDSQTVRFVAARFVIGYDNAILNTTIATLASQTSFTLTTGSADANAYVGSTVLIHDVASAVQIAQATISAYAVTTRTVTLAVDPAIFTMAVGDNISIFPRTNLYSVAGTAATSADISADLAIVKSRLGYIVAREAGACANPQTSAPVYTITLNGVVYTVTMAGVTSTGVRTAPTLTEV